MDHEGIFERGRGKVAFILARSVPHHAVLDWFGGPKVAAYPLLWARLPLRQELPFDNPGAFAALSGKDVVEGGR